MKRTILPGTDLEVPRFIFGTASLFNVGLRSNRLRLLDAAFDHGLTHFDTAPYYGFGMAERDLSQLLERRPEATVTTKVGIYSPGGESQPAATILLRKTAGRILPSISRPTYDWSVPRAKQALEASLRRLGRTHIDLYMLHEPDFQRVDTDEWLRWLEDETSAGRVRRFGVALDTPGLEPFLKAQSPLAKIVQTPDSLDFHEADMLSRCGRPFQITYGYVSSARKRYKDANIATVLRQALERNQDGAIIVSTSKATRLPQYVSLSAEKLE